MATSILSLNQTRRAESLKLGRRVNPKKQREFRRSNMLYNFTLLGPNRMQSPCKYGKIRINNPIKAMRMKMREAKLASGKLNK